jgi:hypothetical protein
MWESKFRVLLYLYLYVLIPTKILNEINMPIHLHHQYQTQQLKE